HLGGGLVVAARQRDVTRAAIAECEPGSDEGHVEAAVAAGVVARGGHDHGCAVGRAEDQRAGREDRRVVAVLDLDVLGGGDGRREGRGRDDGGGLRLRRRGRRDDDGGRLGGHRRCGLRRRRRGRGRDIVAGLRGGGCRDQQSAEQK